MRTHLVSLLRIGTAVVTLIALAPTTAPGADSAQKTFAKPEEAVRAFIDAARKGDQAALVVVLGPGSEDIVSSGDPIADRLTRERVVTAAKARTRIETLSSGQAIAHLGKDDWPLPVPLVQVDGRWRFDAKTGHDEILNRRIGRN